MIVLNVHGCIEILARHPWEVRIILFFLALLHKSNEFLDTTNLIELLQSLLDLSLTGVLFRKTRILILQILLEPFELKLRVDFILLFLFLYLLDVLSGGHKDVLFIQIFEELLDIVELVTDVDLASLYPSHTRIVTLLHSVVNVFVFQMTLGFESCFHGLHLVVKLLG